MLLPAGPVHAQSAALPESGDAPIISDHEFEAAIPPLDGGGDPELDRPWESIGDFERRIASEQAGDRASEAGDPPLRDPELALPLTRLDAFDAVPLELADGASAAPDAPITYRTELAGLGTADSRTPADLRGMFRELSVLRAGDGKAAGTAVVSARLAEDAALVRRILASEGWFSAAVATRIESGVDGGTLRAIISVAPGRRYALGGVVIDAPPTDPETLIRDSLALRQGEPIVAQRVQDAEARVSLALPQNGYAFARLGQRDILLDPAAGTGVYTLPVDIGPRGRFGGFMTEGDLAFEADHVAVLARFGRGDIYDSRKVDDLREALVATGLFASVSAEPQPTGEPAGEGMEYVTVLVRQDAGPPRTIAATAGYATGEGLRLNGSWTHRNLFPPEGALIVAGTAGTKEQGAGVTFRRSNAGRRDRTFELAAEARRSDFSAYNAYTGRIGAHVSYASTPIWQKTFTYAYGINLLATAEKDFDFARGTRNRRTFYVGGLSGQLGLDLTDDLLDPAKGVRISVLAEPEAALNGGFHPYVRMRLDASGYLPLGKGLVLAGRLGAASIQGSGRLDIAPSRRLYAGGGGSVRGFGYQKLGPLDPDGDPLGGRSLNEASAEVRWRFGEFGLVAFVDAGQAYTSDIPRLSSLRYGAGIGGRFYTNFGPMRLDLATPVNRRKGESRVNVYVSIGQAF